MKKGHLYTPCQECNSILEIAQADFDFEYNDEYPEENGIFVTDIDIQTKCSECETFFTFTVNKNRNQGGNI